MAHYLKKIQLLIGHLCCSSTKEQTNLLEIKYQQPVIHSIFNK